MCWIKHACDGRNMCWLFQILAMRSRTQLYTVFGRRTYSLPWITLTNLNVFLLFLAHIILMIRFTTNTWNLLSKSQNDQSCFTHMYVSADFITWWILVNYRTAVIHTTALQTYRADLSQAASWVKMQEVAISQQTAAHFRHWRLSVAFGAQNYLNRSQGEEPR